MRHRFEFSQRQLDAAERVKWCRANLGTRGGRWDFAGGINITIYIRDDADADLYDKHWRFWNVLKGDSKTESHHIS